MFFSICKICNVPETISYKYVCGAVLVNFYNVIISISGLLMYCSRMKDGGWGTSCETSRIWISYRDNVFRGKTRRRLALSCRKREKKRNVRTDFVVIRFDDDNRRCDETVGDWLASLRGYFFQWEVEIILLIKWTMLLKQNYVEWLIFHIYYQSQL